LKELQEGRKSIDPCPRTWLELATSGTGPLFARHSRAGKSPALPPRQSLALWTVNIQSTNVAGQTAPRSCLLSAEDAGHLRKKIAPPFLKARRSSEGTCLEATRRNGDRRSDSHCRSESSFYRGITPGVGAQITLGTCGKWGPSQRRRPPDCYPGESGSVTEDGQEARTQRHVKRRGPAEIARNCRRDVQ